MAKCGINIVEEENATGYESVLDHKHKTTNTIQNDTQDSLITITPQNDSRVTLMSK